MAKKGTVLVAGGAGFVGSHVCDSLLKKNYSVLCLDSLISGDKQNIVHNLDNTNFIFLPGDVSDKHALSDAVDFPFDHIDYILHLASPASPNVDSPRSYVNNPLETLHANSVGTENLLDLAFRYHARLVYASTSEVYGDPTITPQPETYWGNVNPNGIRSVYDESKRLGETLCALYAREYDVDARIIRIFNTYGPRMQADDGRVVSNFITQAITNSPLTVYGDGSQTRSFCYVSDLVEGIIAMMERDGLSGQVINLGNPTERTVLEFAREIITLTDSSSEIVYRGLPSDDPKQRCPDISKAKSLLKWEPTVSLHDGLVRTTAYFKSL